MALHLVAPGSGNPRNVVLVYHVDWSAIGAKLQAAAPGWCVAVETGPAFKNFYQTGGGLTALPAALDQLRKLAGFSELGSLILVGFSEGCQGVRSQLAAGHLPSAVLAVDGIHASSPPADAQLAPWRAYCDKAKAQQRMAVLTHTAIPTTGYLPTSVVVPLVAQLGPAATSVQALDPPHVVQNQGWLWVDSWPGKDAAAHVQQQTTVLPKNLETLRSYVEESAGQLKPSIAGAPGGQGTPPGTGGQGQPPGGQGQPPGGQTTPPGGRPPTAPPAGTTNQAPSSGGGEGLAFLGLFGLALLALKKH